MKTKIKPTKLNQKKKATLHKQKVARKVLIKKNRSTHKKIALNPISIMFLLCVGVVLVMSTINSFADSYTVTAVVPDPPGPAAPAQITNLTDGQHFNTNAISITGTCPTDQYTSVYVGLFVNNVQSGYSGCTSNQFSFSTLVAPGANSVQVRVYDSYNTAGPVQSAITVYYDAPVQPIQPVPPSTVTPVITPSPTNVIAPAQQTTVVAPLNLVILDVDYGTPFTPTSSSTTTTANTTTTIPQVNTLPKISSLPNIAGIAPPYSHVVVTIHTAPVTCDTYANSQGYWSCQITHQLPLGEHHIEVVATTSVGKILTIDLFPVQVNRIVGLKTAVNPVNFTITSNFKDTGYAINQQVNFNVNPSGGVAPYAFSIDWGDGTTSEVTRINSGSFTVSHVYQKTNSYIDNKTIKIEGIDSEGDTASLQLFAPIKNPAYKNFVSFISQKTGFWSIFLGVKSWLWIIWPAYIIIMLMVFSFWLGERQEIMYLISRHKNNHRTKKVALKKH